MLALLRGKSTLTRTHAGFGPLVASLSRCFAGPSALHEGLNSWNREHSQRPKLVVLGTRGPCPPC